MFECDLAHRRYVAVLCMPYKIRCYSMPPLHGALPVRVVRGAVITHRRSYAPPSCRTSQYRRIFIPLSVSLELSYRPCIRWCGTGGFQEQGQCFFKGLRCPLPLRLLLFSLSLLSFYMLVLCDWGLWTDRVQIALSQPCVAVLF